MKKIIDFFRKNSFPVCLIILGGLIFYWVRNYKTVPSGIGPAFFPKVVATMLIGLSIISIIAHRNEDNKGEFVEKNGASLKIAICTAMFITAVLVMKYLNPLLGIFLFLFGYLCVFAKVKWWKSIIISAVGTAIMFVMIILLNISL